VILVLSLSNLCELEYQKYITTGSRAAPIIISDRYFSHPFERKLRGHVRQRMAMHVLNYTCIILTRKVRIKGGRRWLSNYRHFLTTTMPLNLT